MAEDYDWHVRPMKDEEYRLVAAAMAAYKAEGPYLDCGRQPEAAPYSYWKGRRLIDLEDQELQECRAWMDRFV